MEAALRAEVRLLRENIWAVVTNFDPQDVGEVNAGRLTRITRGRMPETFTGSLGDFRQRLIGLGRRQWLREPSATDLSEFEGSESFSLMSFRLKLNIVVLQVEDYQRNDSKCQLHDGAAPGAVDSRALYVATALRVCTHNGLPTIVLMYVPGHFHFFKPVSAEALQRYTAQLDRPTTQRVSAGGAEGVPFPAWYGEEEEGRLGTVGTAFCWCAFHDGGIGAYLKRAEAFREGLQMAPEFRYCVQCGEHGLHRRPSVPRAEGPSLAQCMAHLPRLSRTRGHVFRTTCLYDGKKAAEFVLLRTSPEERQAAADREEERAVSLARKRLLTLEARIPSVAVETAFMRRRGRWLGELSAQGADHVDAVRVAALELASSVMTDSLASALELNDEAERMIAKDLANAQAALGGTLTSDKLLEILDSALSAFGLNASGCARMPTLHCMLMPNPPPPLSSGLQAESCGGQGKATSSC